jgi:hypothetical protein
MNEVKSGAKQIYTIPVSRSIAVLLWKCNDQLGPNAKISHKEHFPVSSAVISPLFVLNLTSFLKEGQDSRGMN